MNWIQELARSTDWQQAVPALKALLLLQILDTAGGVLVSFRLQRLCSTIGWKGFTRKLATLLIICMCGIVDPLMPLEVTFGAAIFYCGWECLSLVEKAALLGVRVPTGLKESLRKWRDTVGSDRDER